MSSLFLFIWRMDKMAKKKENSSVINIGEAIQNAYVHLIAKDAEGLEIAKTAAFFRREASRRQNSAKSEAVKQMLNSTALRINGKQVDLETFVNTFGTAQLEEALGTALTQAANEMNEQFSNIEGPTLTEAVQQINRIIYGSKQTNQKTFNLWLDAVGQALQAVNISPKGFDLARAINAGKNVPTMINVSPEEATAASNIIKYIGNAKERLGKGELTKGSLIGTTRNITGSQLGEVWGKQLVESLDVNKFEPSIDAAVERSFKAKLSGTSRTAGEGGTTAKPDIITNKLFTARVLPTNEISGQIDISANASIKQSSTLTPRNIRLVSGTPILTVIKDSPQYGTYNILAHYNSFKNEYKDFKTFIAGSFMTQYLMGTGKQLDSGGYDTAWFMLISGRAYSMLDIIDDIVRGNSTITIEFPNISAVPKLNKANSTLTDAYERSNKTKDLINKLTITAILNANFYNI